MSSLCSAHSVLLFQAVWRSQRPITDPGALPCPGLHLLSHLFSPLQRNRSLCVHRGRKKNPHNTLARQLYIQLASQNIKQSDQDLRYRRRTRSAETYFFCAETQAKCPPCGSQKIRVSALRFPFIMHASDQYDTAAMGSVPALRLLGPGSHVGIGRYRCMT